MAVKGRIRGCRYRLCRKQFLALTSSRQYCSPECRYQESKIIAIEKQSLKLEVEIKVREIKLKARKFKNEIVKVEIVTAPPPIPIPAPPIIIPAPPIPLPPVVPPPVSPIIIPPPPAPKVVPVIKNEKIKRQEDWIKIATQIHSDECDYSEVEYVNNRVPVTIICKKCGHKFKATPEAHLNYLSCPNCAKIQAKKDLAYRKKIAKLQGKDLAVPAKFVYYKSGD